MKIAAPIIEYSRLATPVKVAPVRAVSRVHLTGSQDRRADAVDMSPVAESLKIGQEALQTKLGEQISAAFDAIGVDLEEAVGVDYSPGAVSDRITDFAASMFELYRNDRPEMSDDDAIDRFEELFVGGVESGYSEAMDLLEGMKMPDQVLSVSRETKGLIDSKLGDFFAGLREQESDAQ